MLQQRPNEKGPLIEAERQSVYPASPPTLQLSCDGRILQELSLDLPRLLIGRSEGNDMSIQSDYVSWYHILLLRHEGSTILVDLNSTNGTFVNSRRVYNRVLANDDIITVDLHSLFVQYRIKYTDPSMTAPGRLGDIEGVDAVIAKALKEVAALLGKDDTDLIPTLTENIPTRVGCIDDR